MDWENGSRQTQRGTRQGDPISPNAFILMLERILDKIRDKEERGVTISGERINNITFEEIHGQSLEETTQTLNEYNNRYGLTMNFEKTQTLEFG